MCVCVGKSVFYLSCIGTNKCSINSQTQIGKQYTHGVQIEDSLMDFVVWANMVFTLYNSFCAVKHIFSQFFSAMYPVGYWFC